MPRTLFHPANQPTIEGLTGEYFDGTSFDAKPVFSRVDKQIDFDWNSASPVPDVAQNAFAVRWTGTITPPAPGTYSFAMRLAHCYPCGDTERFSVYVDGKPIVMFASPANAEYRQSGTPRFTVNFPDTTPREIRVEYTHTAKLFGAGISMEWVPSPNRFATRLSPLQGRPMSS